MYAINSFQIAAKSTGNFLISRIEPTPGCQCIDVVGNVDCSADNRVDISDLTALIDNLYISFIPLCCEMQANIDGSTDGKADIADLTALIDNLYITFTPLIPCP